VLASVVQGDADACIVDLPFCTTNCRFLLAIVFRTWGLVCINLPFIRIGFPLKISVGYPYPVENFLSCPIRYPTGKPVSSEISDLFETSDLLLCVSCFFSQNKEIKFGNYFFMCVV